MERFNSIKNSSKITLFLQKNANFSSAGGSGPRPLCLRQLGVEPRNSQPPAAGGFIPRPPLASGSWGLCPQTAPPLRISAYAPGCAFERRSPLEFGKSAPVLGRLFFGLQMNSGKKSVSFLAKTFFFGLHLICSTEKKEVAILPLEAK